MSPEAAALAHAFVRPLVVELCAAARAAAKRVVAAGEGALADPDAIHDHRVALRRLRTLLAACGELFRRRALDLARDGLRRFARAAGAVRDEEVLAETLRRLKLPATTRGCVEAWLVERGEREAALRAAAKEQIGRGEDQPSGGGAAAGGWPGLSLRRVLELAEALPLRRRAAAISTRSFVLRALGEAASAALDQAERAGGSAEGLHRLRIRFKGVRYTAELFSRAFAEGSPAAAALAARAKAAARMQKRLGEIHDIDDALGIVARSRRLGRGHRMVVVHRLRVSRASRLSRLERDLPGALSLLAGDDGEGPLA